MINIIDLGRAATLLICAFLLSGCSDDLLRYDGFGGPLALGPFKSYVQRLPIERVAAQLECEVSDFLQRRNAEHKKDDPNEIRLNPRKAATISLQLQTDVTGNVTYTGINLGKIGLSDAANLIAVTNNLPSLQAKVAPKSTVSAQLDFNIPQAYHDPDYSLGPDTKAQALKKLQKAQSAPIEGLQGGPPCPTGISAALNFPIEGLYLREWLESFFAQLRSIEDEQPTPTVLRKACLTKLTLKTQFQLLFDFSGGANPAALSGLFVIPVSGLNFDASPAFTHSIQITFAIEPNGNRGLCKDDSQPSRQIADHRA